MAKAPIETRLMNKAVDYLGRYASSQQRLRDVLGRFATRKLDQHDLDEIAAAIDATVTRCQTLGYVNDDAFAQSQARSHRRQGRSQLGIRQRLRQHRLDDEVIDAALDVADEHAANGELLAACRFARRRRIGPFDHGEMMMMPAMPSCNVGNASLVPWRAPDLPWQLAAKFLI